VQKSKEKVERVKLERKRLKKLQADYKEEKN